MLNELWSQRDLTLQLNEHWILVQDDHKKRAKQLEVAFEKNDELEEKINQLQSERLNFKAKQRQADWSMPRQETQSVEHWVNQKETSSISEVDQRSRSSRESFTLFDNENDHHKSTKFSNSSIFIDTDEPTWKSWTIKKSDKLDVNANHYSIEKLRIVYLTFRLDDDADEQIYAKHHIDALSFYLSLTKLLKHLNEIYDIRIEIESVVMNTMRWSRAISRSASSTSNSQRYSTFLTMMIELWWTIYRIKSTIAFRTHCQFAS